MARHIDSVAYAKALNAAPGFDARLISAREDEDSSFSIILANQCREQIISKTCSAIKSLPVVVLPSSFNEVACTCCLWLELTCEWGDLTAALEKTANKIPENREGRSQRKPSEAFERLTPRERDVLILISRGYTVRRCALELGLAESTIGNHKYRMMRKLGVGSSLELLRLAYRYGIVQA